jgi:hypothetical protein
MRQKKQPFQDITNTVNGYLGGSESELENNQLSKPKKQFVSYVGFTNKKCLEEKIFKWQEEVFNGYREHGKPTTLDREVIRDYYSMQ